MVCLGNICRSPLAEGILHAKVAHEAVQVDSAGTGAWHVGQQPDKRSIAVAKKYGIDLSTQRARQFTKNDFNTSDLIYVMDRSNYKNVLDMAPNETAQKKVHLILNELKNNALTEVPDPYYGGDEGFEQVYQLLDDACTVIAEKIQQNAY